MMTILFHIRNGMCLNIYLYQNLMDFMKYLIVKTIQREQHITAIILRTFCRITERSMPVLQKRKMTAKLIICIIHIRYEVLIGSQLPIMFMADSLILVIIGNSKIITGINLLLLKDFIKLKY